MAQKVDNRLSIVLDELKNATNKDQCRRVKLISYFLGLNWSDVEKAFCVPDIYFLLTKHPSLRHQAVAVLQSILQMVGVDADTVAKLGSTQEELEKCKSLPGFAFAEMIMNVILALGDEKFKDLRSLFIGDLGNTHPDNIETPEDLFRRLYQACKVYSNDVKSLVDALNQIQLNVIAGMVQEHQDQQGHPGTTEQATSEVVKLTHQTECCLESKQPEGRTQLVGPKMSTCPESMNSDRYSGLPTGPTHKFPTQTSAFSGLADDERDRVTLKHTQQPVPSKDVRNEVAMSTNREDPPLPPTPEPKRKRKYLSNISTPNCKCACFTLGFTLFAFAIVTGFGDLGLYIVHSNQLKNQVVLGQENDTIIIGKVTGSFVTKVNISEYLEHDDYSHVSRIYVTSKLNLHQHNLTGSRRLKYQPDPDQETGLQDYIYLLYGSRIHYTMCVASVTESSEGLIGNLYVFDDLSSYQLYDTTNAVCHRVLEFGTNNKTVCTSIKSYTASKTGYYFITSDTPGNIVYQYSYNIQQVYLDPDDYNEAIDNCPEGVYQPNSCVLSVKHGDYVLAYIKLPVAADPMTTHLKLQPMSLSFVKRAMAALVCVFGVCSVVFFIWLVYTVKSRYDKHTEHAGYERLS